MTSCTRLLGLLLLLLGGSCAQADVVCFSLAENLYEQIYCELQAQGKSQGLPGWRDFRNNDTTTQALLLKRPAARAGIQLPLPSPKPQPPPARPATSAPAVSPNPAAAQLPDAAAVDTSLRGCELQPQRITCGADIYNFARNQRNADLAPEALTEANQMNLPEFVGRASDPRAVQQYLLQAFEIYVHKMLAIGLAETALSYPRFEFIFHDINGKGVNFSQRFEVMYKFLKQDKARLQVPISTAAPAALALAGCQLLSRTLISCTLAGKHYVFVRE